MKSSFFRTHSKALQWVERKSAENRDAFILARLQKDNKQLLSLNSDHRKILFFNASTRIEGMSLNSAFSILTSISLNKKGINTFHWVCAKGMSQCVLGTNRSDPHREPPCAICIAQSERTYQGASKIEFKYQENPKLNEELEHKNFSELSQFEWDGLRFGEIVIPSIRWVLRKHHIEDSQVNTELLRRYILSAENIARQFQQVIKKLHPDAVVLFNGQFFPEATVRKICLQKGIRAITHEVGLRPMSAFFTDGEATAYPMKISEKFQLSSVEEKVLADYLQQRFQGDFSMAGIRFWPKMHGLDAEFLAKIQNFKQVVPIFTNVVFDTSQGHANILFTDMFAWLDAILRVIKMHPETFFVIRAHPDEGRSGKESQESVAHWAKKNHIAEMENVQFVDFDEYFSSYELIKRSKFVMVYNSTIGLEASIIGVPVLCGGKARYTQYPTVILPTTREEYLQKANEFLDAKPIRVPEIFKENARKFLFFQLFKTSFSFSEFLDPDRFWKGFVHLKRFPKKLLDPNLNPLFQVLSDGIVNGLPFIVENKNGFKEENA